jgi:hypothetical protein
MSGHEFSHILPRYIREYGSFVRMTQMTVTSNGGGRGTTRPALAIKPANISGLTTSAITHTIDLRLSLRSDLSLHLTS